MSEKTYAISTKMNSAYCDYRGQARLSYLLALSQEIATQHVAHIGMGDSYLRPMGKAFIMAKLHLELYKAPAAEQEVHITTLPYLPQRLQYRRCNRFSATDGALYAEIDTRWLLIDLNTRRIVRKPPEEIEFPFIEPADMNDIRPTIPEGELVLREKVIVRYSMVDLNGHMNNTVYGELISNALEERLNAGSQFKEVDIFYHKEVLFGEQIELYLLEKDNGFYIKGVVDDKNCFEACGSLIEAL